MYLDIAALTHIGRRANNEDAFLVDPAHELCVVADGMGGYEGGEVAARIAVRTIGAVVARLGDGDNVAWPGPIDLRRSSAEQELEVATRLAGEAIAAEKRGALADMGTTVAALRLHGPHVVVAHVGDSRIYRIRAGQLEALTLDHSVWGELARAGAPQGPRGGSPYGNVITRALGAAASAPDVATIEVAVGDVLVLCTDGLWEPVDDAALVTTCVGTPPATACAALVEAALVGGGRDNITVIVAHVRAGRR